MSSTESKSVEALVAEVKALRERVQQLEARRKVRARWVVAGVLLVAGAASAQLVTFQADSPAVASDVNANFTLLRQWLEAKVGTVTVPAGAPGSQPITANNAQLTATTLLGDTRVSAGTGNRAMLVTATTPYGSPIVDIRHENQTQGVGIGWSAVFATGSAADVPLNLFGKGTGKVVVADLQAVLETGFQTSCIPSATLSGSLQGFPFCCRINTRDGAVSCSQGNAGGTAWAAPQPYAALGATAPGRYALNCVAGSPGANFPYCCRTNVNSGSVTCGQGSTYAMGTNGTSSPF